MPPTKPLSIFITGGSSGLGLHLATTALSAGHSVIATSRSIAKARQSAPRIESLGGHWFELDVTKPDTTSRVSALIASHNIDVVVNNAGFAVIGACEDFSDEQVAAQFETNVLGLLRVTRGAIPHFRARRSGVIVNIGSGAGIRGLQSRSLYSGSKFAVAGISESLYLELKPFGIRVILVEPGAFATGFLDGTVYPEKDTLDYRDTDTGKVLDMMRSGSVTSAQSAGRPEVAAERILEAITGEGLGAEIKDDLRLVLGSDCMMRLKQKIGELEKTAERNERIAKSTDREQKD